MKYLTLRNASPVPQVLDDGRTVGVGEFASALVKGERVQKLVDAGHLVVLEPPESPKADLSPDAAAAFAATDELNNKQKG